MVVHIEDEVLSHHSQTNQRNITPEHKHTINVSGTHIKDIKKTRSAQKVNNICSTTNSESH